MSIFSSISNYLDATILPSYKYHIVLIYLVAFILLFLRFYIGKPLVLTFLNRSVRRMSYETPFLPFRRSIPLKFFHILNIMLTNILPLTLPLLLSLIVHFINPHPGSSNVYHS